MPSKKAPRLKKKEVIASARRRRARFAEEYSVDMNATRAAKAVGYSEKTAYSTGQRLLSNAEVIAAIEKQRAKLSERTTISAERVLAEIASLAFADIDLKELKAGDKLLALDKLSRHLGLFAPIQVDTTSRVLSLTASVADLEASKLLAESILGPRRAIEGKVEK